PALGGTRFWSYASDDDAIIDALRLSRGMTYKNAVAGLKLGGGKSIIIGDNKTTDRERIFRAHGRFVESLGGRYITAEDVGTSTRDMDYVKLETNHVAGVANNQLLEERHGDELMRRGILYAPDYVANAGGVINVYGEVAGWDAQKALDKADDIYDAVLKVFDIAEQMNIPKYEAADRL